MRGRPALTAMATVLLIALAFIPSATGSTRPAHAAGQPEPRTTAGAAPPAAGAALPVAGAALPVAGAALPVAGAAVLPEQAPLRIMPLGDSITGSPGCWRALLWQSLQDAGHTAVDFVGTQAPQGCGFPYDGEHEGHGGALVTTVADQNQLVGWLAASRPDVVLMHFGTNDVWSNRSTDTILAAYTTLVGQMRASNPGMVILVAQIIPMNPSSCQPCGDRVVDLNAAIPAWASSLSTEQSPILVVDQWTGFDTSVDTYDGVHPNASGDQKMAAAWFTALTEQVLPDRELEK